MSRLERFDGQSDQKIINKTARTPSEDHPGATRLSVEMPWGEVMAADVDKVDFRTISQWCEMIRRAIDARYDSEATAEELRAARAQSRAVSDGAGSEAENPAGAAPSVAAAVPAPQAGVEEDESPAEVLRRNLLRAEARVREARANMEALKKEAATLDKRITALTAALEVLDNGDDTSEDDRETGPDVHQPEE